MKDKIARNNGSWNLDFKFSCTEIEYWYVPTAKNNYNSFRLILIKAYKHEK
jgi:hypothetical protein